MHPVHFAMIGVVSLVFGLLTPPSGLCRLIDCHIAGIKVSEALRDVLVILRPMLVALLLVILLPDLILCMLPKFVRRHGRSPDPSAAGSLPNAML